MKPFFLTFFFFYYIISHRTLLRKRTILIQFLIFNVFSCRSVFEWKIKCRYNSRNCDKSRSKYILFSVVPCFSSPFFYTHTVDISISSFFFLSKKRPLSLTHSLLLFIVFSFAFFCFQFISKVIQAMNSFSFPPVLVLLYLKRRERTNV